MATMNTDAPKVLCVEILAEARRQAEEILQRAREEKAALLAKARAETDQLRTERLAQARAEALRRTELLLATVPVEVVRWRAQRVEAVLQEICDEARQALQTREGNDCRETPIALAAEAVRQMGGDTFVVKLSPDDRSAHGGAIVAAVHQRADPNSITLTLADDSNITDGGVIVQDAEGRQVWDNRLSARLERLWPELRRQIAQQTRLVADSAKGGGA